MARIAGSDELFRLIHSLTKEEKGYFKKFARRHTSKGNKYLKLFDAMNRQKIFDDKTLKNQFKNLPTIKNYLFELVLQSIILSESDPTIFEKILQNMLRSNQLYKRGLTNKALQLISDNIDWAHRTDNYSLEAMSRLSQFNLLRGSWPREEMLQTSKKFQQQITETQNKQTIIQKLQFQQHLALAMVVMQQHGQLNVKIEEQLDMDYLQREQSHISDFAETNRLMAMMFVHILKGDKVATHEAQKKIYESEQKRYMKNRDVADIRYYIDAVANYAGSCIEMHKYETALELAEILGSIALKNKTVSIHKVINYIELKQAALWQSGNHNEGEKFTSSMLKKYDLIKILPNEWWHVISIYTQKLIFEFSNKRYSEALNTMQFFNSAAIQKFSATEKTTAEMLHILIQYEIGNYGLLPSVVRSVQRRNKNLPAAQKYFLAAFAKNASIPGALFKKLGEWKGDEVLYPQFTLSQWLESKKRKKPLWQIVKQTNSA